MAISFFKKKWLKRTLLILIISFVLLIGTLYFLLSSPAFLLYAIKKVNDSIPGQIVYETLDLKLEGRRLRAKDIRYLNEAGQVAVSLESLELGFGITKMFRGHFELMDIKAQGLVVNQAYFPKTQDQPKPWRTVLRLVLRRLSIKESQWDRVELQFKEDQNIKITNLNFQLTPRDLQNERLSVQLEQAQVSWQGREFSSGPLSFVGEVGIPIWRYYDFFVEEASGELEVQQLKIPNGPVGNLSAQLLIQGNQVSLQGANLELEKTEQGAVAFNLRLIPQVNEFELDLKTKRPILTPTLPWASKYLKETLKAFSLDIKAKGKGYSFAKLNGNVDMGLQILGNRAHDNTPDYQIKIKGPFNKGALQLKTMQVLSGDMELNASGFIDFAKQKINTQVRSKNFHVDTMVNAMADLDLKGRANVEGNITGDFKNPTFDVQVHSPQASYTFLKFGSQRGKFRIVNGDLFYDGKLDEDRGESGWVQVKTENIFIPKRRVFLKTEFNNLDVTALLENPELKGKITGQFKMEANPAKKTKSGLLQAKVKDVFMYNFHMDEVDARGRLENQKFIIDPVIFTPPDYESFKMAEAAVFRFDDRGWKVSGKLLPSFKLEGQYSKAQPGKAFVNLELNNTDLKPVLATLRLPPRDAFADAKVKIAIGLGKIPSAIDINVSRFRLPLEEGELTNDGPALVQIRPPKVKFTKVNLISKGEKFRLSGDYTFDGPMALKAEGQLDLALLTLMPKFFGEGEGFAPMDLNIAGTLKKPQVRGQLKFDNARVVMRLIRAEIENITGAINFGGKSVTFDNFAGITRDGDFSLEGKIDLEEYAPVYYDLLLKSREVSIAKPDTYRVIFSGDITLKGPATGPTLSGEVNINEGIYSRDFSVAQSLLKPQETPYPDKPSKLLKNIKLDLKIKSPGELAIKNNIAEMYFSSDLTVKGSVTDPKISGALEVLDGIFSYFKVEFEGAQGVIDFRSPLKGPYVDVRAQKEYESTFDTTTVTAHIQGHMKNLQLNFSSIPPLPRRDIISLVLSGSLPGRSRSLTGPNLATSILASQLSQVLQKPFAKASLDIFRLEATDPDRPSLTTLVVGRRFTDRLSFQFKTDLGVDEPLQGVQMEYLLLDNLLLEATQLSNAEFDFNLALRFRLN